MSSRRGVRRRLAVILATGGLLLVVVIGLNLQALSRVNNDASHVRSAARLARVSDTELLAALYSPSDLIADRLGVHGGQVEMRQVSGSGWCIVVRVEHLLSHRTLSFEVRNTRLDEVRHCPDGQIIG